MKGKEYNAIVSLWELILLRIHHYQGVGPEDYRPVEDWKTAAVIHELAGTLTDKAAAKALQGVSGKMINQQFQG